MDFSGLLPALVAGKIDLIPENLLPTPERASKALFTREVIYNPSAFMAPKSWTGEFENKALQGKRIGFIKGSAQQKMLAEKVPGAVAVAYDGIDSEVLDLKAGRIDLILDGRMVLAEKIARNGGFDAWQISGREFFVPGLENKGSVWAVRRGAKEIQSAVNDTLKAMVADCTYTNIRKKYVAVPVVRDEPAACQ